MEDIRWHQRLDSYKKALLRLEENIRFIEKECPNIDFSNTESIQSFLPEMPNIYKQGLIQSFEFTFELAWKVMQDFAGYQGVKDIIGSRDAIRFAAKNNLLEHAHSWMEMIKTRNDTVHTYNEELANEVLIEILQSYFILLRKFETRMQTIQHES